MKYRAVLFLIVCGLSGCNLGVPPNTANDPVATKTLTNATTLTPNPASELSSSIDAPTDANVPNAASTPVTNTMQVVCTTRSEWETYVIQRGDNLSSIAKKVNSTLEELVSANCLDDPNKLRVGQELFVPNLPASTPAPSATPTLPAGVTATKETRG